MSAIVSIGTGPEEIPNLIKAMEDDYWSVRQGASKLLQQFGSDSISLLIGLLESENAETRADAARALGEMGPDAAEAVPALIELLADDENSVVTAATEALGDIGPAAREALPALRALPKLCKEKRWSFDWMIQEAIAKIEWEYEGVESE